MNIIVVANVDFPEGSGGDTKRVRMICKGLVNQGHGVFLIIPFMPGNTPYVINRQFSGVVDGIYFKCMSGRYGGMVNGLIRTLFNKISIVLKTMKEILRVTRGQNSNLLLLYNLTFYDGFPLLILAKIKKLFIAIEYCDLRFVSFEKEYYKKSLRNFFLNLNCKIADSLLPKYVDAIFVISNYLYNKFANKVNPRKISILPPLVDTRQFYVEKPNSYLTNRYGLEHCKIITYCGTFWSNEGVNYLIEAFAIVRKRCKDSIKLIIVGSYPEEGYEKIKEMVTNLNIGNEVIFLGFKPANEIPYILASSDILVAPKANSILNIAGFPTKLPEYLASGVPTIVSKVGDIQDYATDEKDILFCIPEDPQDLAQKIEFLLENPDLAKEIGINGRKLAMERFDVNRVGEQMVNFLQGIVSEP